ncbi:cytochrome P450, partial [Saccharothrix sp. MB29]|nr:cytochrome P450 [Saccharothrix sp. MB29]
ILAAGVETTATLLTWTFHLLARNPEAERRLWAEVDAVLAGRPASFDDLARLPYAKRVLTEVLRLYPPTWMLSRVTVADTTIAGTTLPRGTDVVISPYALQRDPAVFPDPDTFDPDRWLPERVTGRQK